MNKKDKGLMLKILCYIFAEVLFVCVVLIGLSGLSYYNTNKTTKDILYETTLESYKSEIKSEVQSAISIISTCYDNYKAGDMSEEEAKQKALTIIRGSWSYSSAECFANCIWCIITYYRCYVYTKYCLAIARELQTE